MILLFYDCPCSWGYLPLFYLSGGKYCIMVGCCTSPPNSVLSNAMLAACNHPRREYLHAEISKSYKSGLLIHRPERWLLNIYHHTTEYKAKIILFSYHDYQTKRNKVGKKQMTPTNSSTHWRQSHIPE